MIIISQKIMTKELTILMLYIAAISRADAPNRRMLRFPGGRRRARSAFISGDIDWRKYKYV